MELKGHKKKVMSVALSPDNKRAVTVSQDGTLRVWNIDVRYQMSEDAKTLLTVRLRRSAGVRGGCVTGRGAWHATK